MATVELQTGSEGLVKMFQRPPAEYGATPFWFWNGDLDPEELLRQVNMMHANGVGGFVIHARLGCSVEYLSEVWFDRCRLVVELAAQLGMKVWLYDEENWPSGYAGGKVIALDPQLCARHMSIERHFLRKGGPVRITMNRPAGVSAVLAARITEVRQIQVHPLRNRPPGASPEQSWTNTEHFEHVYANEAAVALDLRDDHVVGQLPEGTWCVMVFRENPTGWHPTYSTTSYVDLLNPATAQAFIKIVHEEYWRRLGKYFGDTIVGFFTDEPGFYNNFLECEPGTLPWTPDFPRQFERRRGYSLMPLLAHLWEEISPRCQQVRADYWRTVAELFEESFTAPLARWCEVHNVKLTGHLLIEESMLAMQRFCASPFSVLRPLQVAGVDRIDEQDKKISEKLVSSIGHATGSSRILSETFALTGWKLAPAYMKRIVDHQYVRGVNMLVPHAFYYSIDDWRRMECPPSLFFQNPWWEHSQPVWDYIARLSAVLSQGRHVAPVALYYPMEQAWCAVKPENPLPTRSVYPEPYFPFSTPETKHIIESTDAAMNRLACVLEAGQYDFDFIDQDLVSTASIVEGKLCLGEESFSAIVVPPVDTISWRALGKMLAFAKAGGMVMFVGRLPQAGIDVQQPVHWNELRDRLSIMTRPGSIRLDKGAVAFVPVGEESVIPLLHGHVRPDVWVVPSPSSHRRILVETQQAQFRQTSLPRLCESLAYHHRKIGEMDVYFVVNQRQHPIAATLRLVGGPDVQRWCPATGQREQIDAEDRGDGTIQLLATLAGYESMLLVLGGAVGKTLGSTKLLWRCPLDDWTWEIDGKKYRGPLVSWHELGLADYSGKAMYRTTFELEGRPLPGIRLKLDLGLVLETARVRINGFEMAPLAFEPYRLDISRQVRAGINALEIEVANTLLNALERIERPSGLFGPVELFMYQESRGSV